jgi:arylsulfatase A-like enzyme
VPISTVDVYATLAELIDYDLECNEAPDSRSLVTYLETGKANAELQEKPIMTHANERGNQASLRRKGFKYVPAENALYNLIWDPEAKKVGRLRFSFMISEMLQNLFYDEEQQAFVAYLDNYLNDWISHLEARELSTEKGKRKDSCFPEFNRFKYLNL